MRLDFGEPTVPTFVLLTDLADEAARALEMLSPERKMDNRMDRSGR